MLCRPDTDTHFSGCNSPFGGSSLFKAIELCEKTGTVIDGGAHIGSWSVYLANVFDTVISFEPLKSNYDCLVENTKDMDNVETYMKALGDKETRMSMHDPVDKGNSGAGWLMEGNDFDVITVDSLNLEELDFLKLDVEGYEPYAIDGALETIKKFHPVILVEQKEITARFGIPLDSAGRKIESLGYKYAAKKGNDFIYV